MSNWIKAKDELPPNGKQVIAYYKNEYGKHRRIRAFYVRRFTIEASPEDQEYEADEYCEEKDKYFLREGWYESNEHEDINWFVDEKVTHWQYFPEPPTD